MTCQGDDIFLVENVAEQFHVGLIDNSDDLNYDLCQITSRTKNQSKCNDNLKVKEELV